MPPTNSKPTVPYAGGTVINTYQNPNFLGQLFNISPQETPFLSLIGGLNGGKSVMTKDFTWQLEADEAPSTPAGISEGQDPSYSSVGRGEINNVVQIFQYGVSITYTKLAASGQLGPQPTANGSDVTGGVHPIEGTNPVRDELTRQTAQKLRKMAKDVEHAFLNGTFQRPLTAQTDGVVSGGVPTPRQTQGIIGAILSDQKNMGGTASPVEDVTTLLLEMVENGHVPLGPSHIFMLSPRDKVAMTKAWNSAGLLIPPRDRFVGGLRLESIVTDFGEFPLVTNRWLSPGEALFIDLSVCSPVHLPIPGKGSVFLEELAHTGARLNYQLYGELGLEYGPPHYHGSIDTTGWIDGGGGEG